MPDGTVYSAAELKAMNVPQASNAYIEQLNNMLAQIYANYSNQGTTSPGYQTSYYEAQVAPLRKQHDLERQRLLADLGTRGITGQSGAAIQALADLDNRWADEYTRAANESAVAYGELGQTQRNTDLNLAATLASIIGQQQNSYLSYLANKENLASTDYWNREVAKNLNDQGGATTVGNILNLLGVGQGGLTNIVKGGVDLYKTIFPTKTNAPTAWTPTATLPTAPSYTTPKTTPVVTKAPSTAYKPTSAQYRVGQKRSY